MKLLVISDAPIIEADMQKVAYAPYVVEMKLWMRYTSCTTYFCPSFYNQDLLTIAFQNQDFKQYSARRLEFNSIFSATKSAISIPYQFYMLFRLMARADHIHLRAPGNLALLACIAQIFFPLKAKTAKYAGNWDPEASQPLSYRWQKWILSNSFLTRNMAIMAYGEWPNQSVNVNPFFTATYSEKDRRTYKKKIEQPLQFIFVGTLSQNKNPQLLIKLVQKLHHNGIECEAHFYGDGPMMEELNQIISSSMVGDRSLSEGDNTHNGSLKGIVKNLNVSSSGVENSSAFNKDIDSNHSQFYFHGNQPAATVKKAYEKAHFVFLASHSEGWPKVVAEGMWHGCIPIASAVSCVPWMLNFQIDQNETLIPAMNRGIVYRSTQETVDSIKMLLSNPKDYAQMSVSTQQWSQQYTIEKFEKAIQELLEK